MLRELVLLGGGAALGALVPLAAGAHAAARAASRPRLRAHAPPRPALYRPYHKFIGEGPLDEPVVRDCFDSTFSYFLKDDFTSRRYIFFI